ncbi:MAG: hypothetical protein M3O71_15515 [Bacteroidota bacterium]|nr:hypothetical protein [Bacteroidota bacterium]
MSAIVIDLKDFEVRTHEQNVRIFLSLYDPETIYAMLMEAFISCTKNNPKEEITPDPGTVRIANLFDHLIALTTALHQLRENTPGTCVICGRSRAGADPAG